MLSMIVFSLLLQHLLHIEICKAHNFIACFGQADCKALLGTDLQSCQELILLAGYAGNDSYDAQDCAKQQSGYLCSLVIRELHHQAAMLEAIHHVT